MKVTIRVLGTRGNLSKGTVAYAPAVSTPVVFKPSSTGAFDDCMLQRARSWTGGNGSLTEAHEQRFISKREGIFQEIL